MFFIRILFVVVRVVLYERVNLRILEKCFYQSVFWNFQYVFREFQKGDFLGVVILEDFFQLEFFWSAFQEIQYWRAGSEFQLQFEIFTCFVWYQLLWEIKEQKIDSQFFEENTMFVWVQLEGEGIMCDVSYIFVGIWRRIWLVVYRSSQRIFGRDCVMWEVLRKYLNSIVYYDVMFIVYYDVMFIIFGQ